ncbi:MAG: hypothetical protein BroJett011_77030 [Chloroflexota bacterium]|nr:MAG: hypothetical protein BroJett011_77030 [Chloroflexota bacterium]
MNNSGDEAITALFLLGVSLFLCLTVLLLGIVFLVLMALLFLGWVLTYWLLRAVNEWLTENWVTESEGLLALVIPGILYLVLAWWFVPSAWVEAIAFNVGWSVGQTWLRVVVGAGLLGLGFGLLSLPMLESREEDDQPTLDATGMLALPSGVHDDNEAENSWELLNDGVLLGEDI